MLGFCPRASTAQNYDVGKRMLEECPHPCVRQLCEIWQDPATYYAFETKEGASWWTKHTGLHSFARLLRPPEFKISERTVSWQKPTCFSCGQDLDYFHKTQTYQLAKCTCGTRVSHKKCFLPPTCPTCGTKFIISVENTSIHALTC